MPLAVYPSLPGLKFGSKLKPMFSTKIAESSSGVEYRQKRWVYPKWSITLEYEFLRNRSDLAELETLQGFFLARQGAYEPFLISLPEQKTVSLQAVGVADGVTSIFQLVANIGGFLMPIDEVKGAPAVYVNGDQAYGFSLLDKGRIQFITAPVAGPITWSGEFYHRVRFKDDAMEFDNFLNQLWSAKKVEMVSAR
ncbi:DUF2460 domain-containing protein [Parvibium lacunae]|uniref:DUF2460 domain-containing protein n=1 Tax=Parvibium lacunae TaxID=1888893 RepID=A0A368L7S2_9BURK|nr:DUF2460 domain-containing protein [Parvibium lacunae]RCS59715.1 hypothetical protein DU000_03130 [Parvibium lacunae]